jgi:hypothetical protein
MTDTTSDTQSERTDSVTNQPDDGVSDNPPRFDVEMVEQADDHQFVINRTTPRTASMCATDGEVRLFDMIADADGTVRLAAQAAAIDVPTADDAEAAPNPSSSDTTGDASHA